MAAETTKIRLLIIEDSEDDAMLLLRMLRKSGFSPEYIIVDNQESLQKALTTPDFDLIISDFDLKGFTGIEAFEMFQQTKKDIPFIIVSGAIGEELAVEAMRRGVQDYLMKDKLGRLIPVIKRELNEAQLRKEQAVTELALEYERNKFQLLVEGAPIAIMIFSNQGKIQYINDMAEKTFGYALEEYDPITEFIPKLFQNETDSQWMLNFWTNEFDPNKKLPEIDFPLILSKDGTPKYIKFRTAPIRDSSFILMAEDITKLKRTAISLENSQKRLENIFDTVEDIIIEIVQENEAYFISNVNTSFTVNTGIRYHEAVDQKIESVLLDDPLLFTSINRAIKGDNTVSWENELNFPVGNRHWEIFVAPLFTDDGKLYRIILTARDITARKQQEIKLNNSEKKYRLVSSIASDAIWEWFMTEDQIEWNEGITTLFGYEKEKIGHTIDWVKSKVHEADIDHLEESLQKSLGNKEENWIVGFRFRCADESYKYVNSMGFIFYDIHRNPTRILGAMIDQTHRLKSEELRIKSLVDGADSERKAIAEELHDNLGQNLSLASILLDQVPPEQKGEKVVKATKIINKSIEETRNMAHALMPKAIHDFGLKAAILSLLNNIKLVHDYQINVHFNFDEERFNAKIETNLYRIVQEATNNIIKHAQAKIIFIQMIKSESSLSLTIEDDGIGFDQTKNLSKNGIGLKNIENRVYYLDGKLTMESAAGNGTLLLIDLPLH